MVQIKPKNLCPLLGMEPCRELDCAWFVQVRGTNPNTGKEIDEWNCSIPWLPVLILEVAGQTRQAGASVDQLRKEVAEAGERASQQPGVPMVPLAPLMAKLLAPKEG